ncbi:uncharacterized protein LOC117817983 isoform X1 [Notolabrus celidotus]|uniref:uncharacterized protein LOC117817983 isoform X1 n=1 Tax=Notolabrus celidotus TaxID=1203425 RepID=UPI00148FDFED|nr:uncharacterized protein LOC117817983 isoform X1 [Notolabrus celidotus]
MDAVFGLLLLLLLGVCHGVETSCDGRQNGAECYGALGGTVLLRLMDDASEIYIYNLKKETTVILHGRRGNILTDLTKSRFSFTPNNGTFRINNLSRDDGGQYSSTAYLDSSGTNPVKQTLQLIIQAPVSSVQLVPECQSQGEMRVSCSSGGGDSPQYSWTLDGQTLTGTQLLSGNSESQNITLKQDVSGQLKCTVRNHISSVPGEEMISTCGFKLFECTLLNGTYISQWLRASNETMCIESTTEGKEPDITVTNKPSYNITPSNHTGNTSRGWYINISLLICVLEAAVFFLIIIGIFLYFAWRKNKLLKGEGSAAPEEVEYENNSVVMVEMRSSAAEP